jgi:hypothetical protein
MAVFIEIQADKFKNILQDLSMARPQFENVRRPFRGIEIKEDTYAVLKVIRSNGKDIGLFDSGARLNGYSGDHNTPQDWSDPDYKNARFPAEGSTFNYSNFIAQQVVDARQEKSQVVETFGEPYIFFFGEKPRILQVSGVLFNTFDFAWKTEFMRNYEKYLRGTKLVEMNARTYFYYDDQIVEGYMLNAQVVDTADTPYHVQFMFNLFVTSHIYLGVIDSTGAYPISANVQVPGDSLTDKLNFNTKIRQLREQADALGPDQLRSSIEDVRLATIQNANYVTGKASIQGAIIKGLADFEASTKAFLDNVKTYFYGRRTVVPKGLAGAERYAGEAEEANVATITGEPIQRELPLRSRISDNFDEYVGDFGMPGVFDQDAIDAAIESNRMYDADLYELSLRAQLATMGVDVTDPNILQKFRSNATNTIVSLAGTVDFVAGLGNSMAEISGLKNVGKK